MGHWVEKRYRYLLWSIVGLGALARLVWIVRRGEFDPMPVESQQVAAALVREGRFADPFLAETGATAHVGPATVWPTAIAYRLFGVETPLAEVALQVVAVLLSMVCVLLAARLMRAAGAGAVACLGAAALACFVPLQISIEIVEMRVWEGMLAACLLLFALGLIIEADKAIPSGKRLAAIGAVVALCLFVNQAAGLGAGGAFALLLVRRVPPRRWVAPVLGFVVALTLTAGPWAMRNAQELGRPIPFRDNLGLELALANNDYMARTDDRHRTVMEMLDRIHPMKPAGLAALRRSGGEVAYYDQLKEQVIGWIGTHPADFARLSLVRASDIFFPPAWYWTFWGEGAKAVGPRQALTWAISALALLSLATLAWRRRSHAYVAVALPLAMLPYVLVQPVFRYRYLIATLLVFVACDGLMRLIAWLRSRPAMRIGLRDELVAAE
jgi:hypothetical protein